MRDDSSTLHSHRRLQWSAVVRSCIVSLVIGLLFTSCGTVMPTPTAVPSSTTKPAPPVKYSQLPQFVLDPSLPSDIVLNADQGLGQCHWVDPNIVSNPLVSWAYDSSEASSGWNHIEPAPGVFQWDALDAEIATAQSLGKRIWIELHTTEGRTPQWALDAGVQLVGSRGGTPVPWNPTYQQLLRRAVHAMAARYDGHPDVDAINIMAGGCYGEMAICAKQFDMNDWEAAGYTDDKYIEAVKQIVDIYLEEEYTWPDDSKTHGFLKTPVVLQLGAGLYERTLPVIQPVVQHVMSNYGMRVWLKFNGLGGGYEMRWVYQDYDTATGVGYEPMGNSQDFIANPKYYVRMALDHHSSYLCLQAPYFEVDTADWREAREMAARYLGAQIVHQATEAPGTVLRGQQHTFRTTWVNRGTVPLMRPERQGTKDVPASYDIEIAFVDAASGVSVFEHTFTPAVPTTQWYSAQPVAIAETIPVPASVPAGTYDLRLALVNPILPIDHEHRYFRLVNTSLHDGSGRYTVGRITVSAGTAPTATPTAVQPAARPNLPPVIFVMLDWMNGDWGNPDYQFSYIDKWGYRQEYRGHPEYGALGGWAAFHWDDLNPEKEVYNWSKLDRYIKNAQAMKVTLPDGSVIAKPVGIAIETWAMEETDEVIGVNYTPYWVAAQGGGSTGHCYDPDGPSGPCKPFCTPRYTNTAWQYWFDQFILAMGQRYDNDPEFHNLAFINIATGADEENNERKNFGNCEYFGGNTKEFEDWVAHVMETYNLAFPNTVQFVQSTLHGIHYDAERAASFPSGMSGVKVNGLEVDVPSAEIHFDGVLVGGVTGFSEVWHEEIPTGYEPKHGNGIEGSYWFYMQGLYTHPYMFDIQLPNIQDAYLAEGWTDFPIQDFVRDHLGRTVQNTPDVWIVLRDTYGQDSSWTGSDGIVRTYGPHHGDFDYWLYRPDSAPGSRTFAIRGENLNKELPTAARQHIYGWHSTRRTDQAAGNPYMSFDVDDRYRHAGMVPEAAGGQVSWAITMTLVNRGTDTLTLEYKDYFGNLVERKVTKGPLLGPPSNWVDYTWNVNDAYFDNGLPGGTDFRIDCNGDGDEIIHRLIVSSEGPLPPPPTPTNTLPPTRTPTRTTTPATPTPTGTRVPTVGPSPSATNTRLASPTPTSGPSPTPTSTPTLFPSGRHVVTLRQGLLDYRGNRDTYLSAWTPAENFANQANLRVKNDSIYAGLLRFDLRSIPPGSTINQATLRVYAYYRESSATFDLEVYRVLRPWVDTEANWTRASVDNPWGMPGANDTSTDRAASPAAVQTIPSVDTWYDLDITQLVGDWVADPQANHGVLLRGLGLVSVVYHFGSADHLTPSLRPELVIDYTAPEAPPTPTPGTPTPTTMPTDTPTGTITPPTPTPTGTPTELPLPTSTQTPSATPPTGPTPTLFPRGRNVVTLRQGLLDYRGSHDTYLSAWTPEESFANQANLRVKNDGIYAGLLRFDVRSVPPGSTINQATLRVYAYYRESSATFDLEVYRVLRPWVDTEANWNRAAVDNPWGMPGASDTTTDRAASPIAVLTVPSVDTWYELDLTALVGDWVADPQANHGVLLRGLGLLSAVYHFGSAEHTVATLRPQLVIDYTAPEDTPTPTPETPTLTATPTDTPTEVPSPTSTQTPAGLPSPTGTQLPSATPTTSPSPTPTSTPTLFPDEHNVVALQQGVLGYLGTNDTYITTWNPSGNFVYQANLIVKNDSAYAGLLRFDVRSVPPGSTINQAVLRVYAYYSDRTETFDLEIYRVLRPWVDAKANWNRASVDNPWGMPGANDTATDRAASPIAVRTVPSVDAWYELDVTDLVGDWVADSQANHGVVLRGLGQAPVVYHFASANHPTISLRPQLVIDYTGPGVPVTPVPPTATQTPTATRTPSATPEVPPTATPTASPIATETVTPTPAPSGTPTPGAEGRVEDMERRVGIVEQLLQTIIDIFRRASHLGR